MTPREGVIIEGSIQGLADRELQAELRDLLCLAVVGDHLRWVLSGHEAAELAECLADATAQWRGWADQVAKHLVSLGVPPDRRLRSLAEDIPLNWAPDADTRALLDTLCSGLETLSEPASGMTLVNSARELEHRDATLAPTILRRSRR